jgi:hypothetical protein
LGYHLIFLFTENGIQNKDNDKYYQLNAEKEYFEQENARLSKENTVKGQQLEELKHYKKLLSEKEEMIAVMRKDISNLQLEAKIRPSYAPSKPTDSMSVQVSHCF